MAIKNQINSAILGLDDSLMPAPAMPNVKIVNQASTSKINIFSMIFFMSSCLPNYTLFVNQLLA
jgi:hypothetical protein